MKTIATLLLLLAPCAMAAPKKISQEKFASEIQKSLPGLFCGKEAYFRKCFQLSEAECNTAAQSAVSECVKELKEKMPAEFQQAADGQKWGQETGTCAGAKFEKAQLAKKTDSADCKNQDKWK